MQSQVRKSSSGNSSISMMACRMSCSRAWKAIRISSSVMLVAGALQSALIDSADARYPHPNPYAAKMLRKRQYERSRYVGLIREIGNITELKGS